MRIRSIKPEFFRDPDSTGRWPAELRVFYIGLWCVADDAGRFAWDEELIAADLFPFDRAADVAGLLNRLVQAERVVPYAVAGRKYGFLPKFAKHQRINRPTPSRLPEPPSGLTEDSVNPHGGLTSGRDQGSGSLDQGSGESAELVAGAPPPAPPPPPSDTRPTAPPVVATLPCIGKGPQEFAVTEAQVAIWREAYPGVDILGEIRRANVWLEANPTKRKTYKGVPRFLVSWFGRAQDRGGRAPPKRTPAPRINGDRFWDYLSLEEREQYLRERAAIDPELADAPFGATGVHHEAEVVALHQRWTARIESEAEPRAAAGGAP
jgi:hypothetical protein